MTSSAPNPNTSKSPAFQFYANDFTTGTLTLTTEEVGAYILLMCHCWDKGFIPSDLGLMARIARISQSKMRRAWESALSSKFKSVHGGYVQPRLERERQKQQQWREKSAAGGRRSQANRKDSATTNEPPLQPVGQPKADSSAFSLQTSVILPERTPGERARENGNGSERILAADDVKERAARFTERYAELFREHRRGARYVGKPTLDYQEAITLCANWDSDRLEKLAIAFLTTDEKFCRQGSGSIAQFRSRASWCDDKLREKGL